MAILILIYGGKVDCNYQGIETVYYDNNVTERLHKLKKEEKHGGGEVAAEEEVAVVAKRARFLLRLKK